MFDRIQGNDMYNGATNPPMNASPTLNNVALSNPGLNVKSGSTITAARLPILPLGVTGIQAKGYKLPTTYQFRGDVNNGGISLNAGAGNFGAVTAAFGPREFQLGAKLIF